MSLMTKSVADNIAAQIAKQEPRYAPEVREDETFKEEYRIWVKHPTIPKLVGEYDRLFKTFGWTMPSDPYKLAAATPEATGPKL